MAGTPGVPVPPRLGATRAGGVAEGGAAAGGGGVRAGVARRRIDVRGPVLVGQIAERVVLIVGGVIEDIVRPPVGEAVARVVEVVLGVASGSLVLKVAICRAGGDPGDTVRV